MLGVSRIDTGEGGDDVLPGALAFVKLAELAAIQSIPRTTVSAIWSLGRGERRA